MKEKYLARISENMDRKTKLMVFSRMKSSTSDPCLSKQTWQSKGCTFYHSDLHKIILSSDKFIKSPFDCPK